MFGALAVIAPEFLFRGNADQNLRVIYAASFIGWGLIYINPMFYKHIPRNYLWVMAPMVIHMIGNIIDITLLNVSINALPIVVIYGSYLYLIYQLELSRVLSIEFESELGE
jgi:hypothetical protein